jgi:predicted O-methyltransferase YrrM
MKNLTTEEFCLHYKISRDPVELSLPTDFVFGEMVRDRLSFLCSIAAGKDVLEIGTFRGVTTCNLAKYASTVTTLDIDNKGVDFAYEPYIVGEWFTNRNCGKIVQQLGNTREMNFLDLGMFDMVLIDGDHSYEGCLNDFVKSLAVVKHGGLIIIDDYDFNGDMWPGVKKTVHFLVERYPLFTVTDKLFVMYEKQ